MAKLTAEEIERKLIKEGAKSNELTILEIYQLMRLIQTMWNEPTYLCLIDHLPEKAKLIVIKTHAQFIEHIESPSEEIQLEAIKRKLYTFKYIENPTKRVKKLHNKLTKMGKQETKKEN